ncbi:MAG: exodeoxyribonuclease VII large subunit [Deltaproteobacteria bacterium]|nr:exodeoxyribonuclease VII large subunit [Deltaproteobacteria bacterium]
MVSKPGDAKGAPALQVSELVELLRGTLREAFGEVLVEGEIASLFRSRPGHLYFDLKDEGALLRAVMFRGAASAIDFEPRDGMLVQARGRVDLYAERGSLQLVLSELRPAGEGALRAAFEKLKARLAAEGLFDAEHKRPLPFLPRRIGLVTSIQGAVIHDFLRALRARFPASEVVVWDARVQGEGAWREIVRGLHLLDADPSVEVIVLARGGGSLEDLWNFNREELVRAVFELATPVVSAIGHESDWVLCDLVADARAATPTAAAALVAPDAAQLLQRVDELELRMARSVRALLRELSHRLLALRRGLIHPALRLRESALRLRELRLRLSAAAARAHERAGARLAALAGRLDALSPLAVLGRGFALATRESDGAILRDARQAPAGESILVRLARGRLRATVRESLEDG